MRRAASYSCPWCTKTQETQAKAQAHNRTHLLRILKEGGRTAQIYKQVTVNSVDPGRQDISLHSSGKLFTLDDSGLTTYTVIALEGK